MLTLAACGGSSADKPVHATTTTTATPPQRDYSDYYPPGTHKASVRAIKAITGWSDELRAGHVRKASTYFDIPVVVQNASPVYRLKSKKDVFDFNNMLPCGAHIVKTFAGDRYTVATFVLTERPGSSSGCGATGKLAAAAFLLRHGKISEWRRVLVPPPLGPAKNMAQPELQS